MQGGCRNASCLLRLWEWQQRSTRCGCGTGWTGWRAGRGQTTKRPSTARLRIPIFFPGGSHVIRFCAPWWQHRQIRRQRDWRMRLMRRPKNMAGPELGTQETHPHAVPSRELGGLCDGREKGRKGARVTSGVCCRGWADHLLRTQDPRERATVLMWDWKR